MPRIKADSGKSNKTPFCGRRKKLKPKTNNLFTEEKKKSLAESDPKTILAKIIIGGIGSLFGKREDGDAEGLPNTEKVECPAEGVSSLQRFSSCKKCQTKLIRNDEKQLVKCAECGLAQLFHKCQQRLIANVMFLKAGNTISLLLFEDKLKQLYHIYTSQVAGGSTESFESLDDDSIIEFLLTVEATVCYNTKKNVVSVDKKN
ncbi:Hypothetical predicted protein [Paramuricea clavata]|uniref:Uncharacterized protein n=1 Tax=Paramuricea clavata TaxID=317549 RepID=A0A6S7JGG0_PARCT|nr:Hypothetical predicted protein [Paramuricea clavata]